MTQATLPATQSTKNDNGEPAPAIKETALAELGPEGRAFELAQRKATALSKSGLVPADYRNNVANCMIALELAERTRSSPFMVMQNVHIINGRPSWSSTFIIAAINACGRFSPLRFEMEGEGDAWSCVAWAFDIATEAKLYGPKVTMDMAKKEGWATRNGSKWKTMPELMMHYRAAAFFGRLYAPDILMGMLTSEESEDVITLPRSERPSAQAASDALEKAHDVTPKDAA